MFIPRSCFSWKPRNEKPSFFNGKSSFFDANHEQSLRDDPWKASCGGDCLCTCQFEVPRRQELPPQHCQIHQFLAQKQQNDTKTRTAALIPHRVRRRDVVRDWRRHVDAGGLPRDVLILRQEPLRELGAWVQVLRLRLSPIPHHRHGARHVHGGGCARHLNLLHR